MHVVPAEAGRSVLGGRVLAKLGGSETAGACFLFHATTPSGHGPPLHAHEREDETFYVLEGHYEMRLGGTRIVAPPGSCLHLPRYRAHAFVNIDTAPGEFLGLVTPAGLEHYFEAVSALGPGADDLARRGAVGLPFGIHFPADPDELAPVPPGAVVSEFAFMPPGTGQPVPAAETSVRCLLGSGETKGACTLLEVALSPRQGWPAWRAREQLVIFVLDGELELEASGHHLAGSGATVSIRPEARLRIVAAGTSAARFLLCAIPGGLETRRPLPWL